MSTTRTSETMASSILRTFSAWRSFAIGELDLVDIGDALDDVGHLVAEAGGNLLIGGGRVLNRVVQQAGGDGVESIFISASTSATSSG